MKNMKILDNEKLLHQKIKWTINKKKIDENQIIKKRCMILLAFINCTFGKIEIFNFFEERES